MKHASAAIAIACSHCWGTCPDLAPAVSACRLLKRCCMHLSTAYTSFRLTVSGLDCLMTTKVGFTAVSRIISVYLTGVQNLCPYHVPAATTNRDVSR